MWLLGALVVRVAVLGRNRGRAFACIKNQLLKHLEVWEDFEDLAVHSSVYCL